ncbi:MAG: 4a-hydroxytetrahydrobiopterin dehydratase [Verrucomicrobia bacterium]|nr:4a-hydroxytetrahydrobiopterin dehydratase [Verrucomicrobiota bacterium]
MSSCDLSKKSCTPCKKGVPPLKGAALKELQKEIDPNWQLIDEAYLERSYSFKDFKEALAFTNRVGEVAEAEGHHPDIFLAYGKVKIKLWTHKINGLSENDFILARKCDALL